MCKGIKLLIIALGMVAFAQLDAFSSEVAGDGPVLVTIGGEQYSTADYTSWWKNWREEGMDVPVTPASFIDWVLLVNEAKRMNLDSLPAYKGKVSTFLKVRSLMMLKQEEVDAKIHITDEILRQEYDQSYVPVWQIDVITFETEQQALAAYEKLQKGSVTAEDMKSLSPEEGGALSVRRNKQRPYNTHEEWQNIIKVLGKSGFSKPQPFAGKYVILGLVSAQGSDDNDFEQKKKTIYNTLHKTERNRLTSQLVGMLVEKYDVQVDYKQLDELDLSAPDSELSDRALVTYKDGQLSELDYMQIYRRHKKQNAALGFVDADKDDRHQVMAGIISQTFTTREALARHYEKVPPLKDVFEFYTGHRLVRELERQVFVPPSTIAEEEVKKYYEVNTVEFTMPALYRLGIMKGAKSDLHSILKKVLFGDDFIQLAKEASPHAVIEQSLTENNMDEELKSIASVLTQGEMSKVFSYQGEYALIKLIMYRPPQTLPYSKARVNIEKKLQKDQVDRLRTEFVQKLRNSVSIAVDEKVWKDLYTALKKEDDTHKK